MISPMTTSTASSHVVRSMKEVTTMKRMTRMSKLSSVSRQPEGLL